MWDLSVAGWELVDTMAAASREEEED